MAIVIASNKTTHNDTNDIVAYRKLICFDLYQINSIKLIFII